MATVATAAAAWHHCVNPMTLNWASNHAVHVS